VLLPECGGGFGAGGFGAIPFGDGQALAVLEARAVARNAVDVTFLGIPKAFDAAGAGDALNPTNWTLAVRTPFGAVERLVQHVEETSDPTVIRVFADGPFTALATYRVTASELVESATGIPIDPNCRFADFLAFAAFRPPTSGPPREDERTDLATSYKMLNDILGIAGVELPAEAPPAPKAPPPAPEPAPESAADPAPEPSMPPEGAAPPEAVDGQLVPPGKPPFQNLPEPPPPGEASGAEDAKAEAETDAAPEESAADEPDDPTRA